jgi:hypothetical protein
MVSLLFANSVSKIPAFRIYAILLSFVLMKFILPTLLQGPGGRPGFGRGSGGFGAPTSSNDA